MSTVPAPRPGGPLPRPGAPAEREPPREQPERREASPTREEPDWLPQPYDPQRESEPMREPASVP